MAENNKSVIKHRLLIGFISIILLFIAFGVISLLGIRGLSKVTRTIYNHPLVVSNASLHATLSMTKMHRSMKDVALFDFPFTINTALTVVNEQEDMVYKNLDSVKKNILGDEGQKLENETRYLFVKWKPIREEVIKLVRKGQREEAARITMGKGAVHVTKLEDKMLELTSYARKKATGFMEHGERVRSRVEETTIILMLIGILLSTIITFFTIRRTKATEEALRQSEELHRITLRNISDAVFITDDAGVFTYICPNVDFIFGYSYEEVDAFGNIDRLLNTNLFDRNGLESSREVKNIEYVIKDKSGVAHFLLVNVKLVSINGGTVLYTCRDITERKEAEEALQKAHDELEKRVKERTAELSESNLRLKKEIAERKRTEQAIRNLSSKLLNAYEEERKRIALEIHDSLGQSLSAIKYMVENVIQKISDEKGVNSAKLLESIVPVVKEAVEEVRRIQRNLRPPILDDLGILPTIMWFCREFETTYPHLRLEKQIDIQEDDVPDSLKIIIFRVLQEAFNNITKHSKAKCIRLSLKGSYSKIYLTINDDGTGFDVDHVLSRDHSERGLGLSNMKERAELSGGTFLIESSKGLGTTVRALWPVS